MRSVEYRRSAASMLDLAQRADSVADKNRLLVMAEAWLDLAARAAKPTAADHPPVGFGPFSDICSAARSLLFDHLVGARGQPGRYFETECLGRLQVDHELELGGLIDGKVGWLSPFRILQNYKT